ncbi:O-antigen polymerase [Acinetobacter lwoffii]|uniref:O-antigen polymerase n=1 Tax=Acinetobacter lwoffii TaxID=28090 RepID=UPI001FF4AE8F|nr:O-antigen polymerase [Acinetobacter lwoffii]MCJ8512548.1 oligosaccharide repeat unit polymerase [Acinetobacter lwoffii]
MVSLLFNMFFCFLSLFIYIFAPEQYSYKYCLFLLIIFLIVFLLNTYINDVKEGFGFGILFSIAFLFSNFIYPVFYIVDYTYVSSFIFPYNQNVVNKATAVALVAYCFYVFGVTQYNQNYTYIHKVRKNFIINSNTIYSIIFLLYFSIFLFVIFGGYNITKALYSGDLGISVQKNDTFGYAQILIFIFSMLLASIFYYSKNYFLRKVALISIVFVAMFMLSTGTRLLAVNLFIMLLAVYSREVRKITIKTTLLFCFLGANFLYIIMLIRENQKLVFSSSNDTLPGLPFDIFMDLIGTNRNLYILYDYVDNFGSLFFLNELPTLLSVFPFSGFFIDLLPVEVYKTSGLFPTYLTFGPNANYGLGTSMVGEAYLSFGLLGVIFVFFAFGWVIKKTKLKSLNSIYFSVIYFYLVGQSVFYPRINYFWGLKNVFWMLMILLLLNYLFDKKRS